MKSLSLTLAFLIATIFLFAQTQPAQPATGPGGSDYTYGGVTQFDYGTNGNGQDFWLYEPNSPTPDSANVVVFIHGLGETNPKLYGAFIKHLVRKGNIVIYPRYQKDLNSDNTTFSDSCAKGIQRALDTLQQAGHVKPRLNNFFVLGHSVGGILTANMSTRYAMYGLPKPLTAFSMQPGANIPQILLSDYSGFESDIKYLILVGNDDIIVGSQTGEMLFNQTTSVPTSHKNLLKHFADSHGSPALGATHFEPLAGDVAFDNGESNLFILASGTGPVDAFDYYGTWKLQDALMDCALNNQNCDLAFGDTPGQKSLGNWSDGTPLTPMQVTPSAANTIGYLDKTIAADIFPNPSTGGAWQLMLDASEEGATLLLYDLTGKIVESKSLVSGSNSIGSNCAAGTYFYKVIDKTGRAVVNGKLIAK